MKIGYSTCPNDTFIFDALVHHRYPHELHPEPALLDVETLNRMATKGELPVSKLSFAAFAFVSENYQILSSGAALGNNCGPLVIYNREPDLTQAGKLRVAIPGKFTTANLLLSIFYPELTQKKEMVFSDIEDAVLSGKADLGLIIHENRFTYEQKGLKKLADLGEKWEQRFGVPIPLGCIAVSRHLPEKEKMMIQEAIRKSVEWAFQHPQDSREYVMEHAREMSETVQQQHISLYVNRFSVDLGDEGRRAVELLMKEGVKAGLLPIVKEPIFVEN
ncbi:MAG: 1,4-dihydroxy-6-naphthoate synthase [Bacteroidia bacterium]